MSQRKQAWLVALGGGGEPLPDEWLKERPRLLREWPIEGGKVPRGIVGGDHLLYYAAHRKKLIAVARATGVVSESDTTLGIQLYLAIPDIPICPRMGGSGKGTGDDRGPQGPSP